MPVVRRLRLADYLAAGAAGHFHRSPFVRDARPHRHDFAEIFWVDAGRGWHWIDGVREEAATGLLRLVAPEDAHGFEAIPGKDAQIANLALPLARLRAAVAAWCPEGDPLALPAARRRRQLGADGLARLRTAAVALDTGRQDARAVDQLLLTALDLVLGCDGVAPPPEWLAQALEAARRGAGIGGASGLARLCGRSREHVARACRQHFARSPTELLDGLRMARAAELVAGTDLPLSEVATRCGLASLAHFYRRFRVAHGVTPSAWRRRSRALIGH